jgi:hypothetical protein
MVVSRNGFAFFGLGPGYRSTSPRDSAAQSLCTGHVPQAGFLRVHSVAPRSIIACV